MARAKAAKIGFRQVNTGSSLEETKIFTAVWSEKSRGKSGNGVSLYAASWRFLIRSLQHYTASWLSRYHEQSLELRLLESLSFGQGGVVVLVFSRSSAGPQAC